MLVLEDLEAAQARGATIIGELLGYGATADAHHLTAPEPQGRGAIKAIQRALQDAELLPEDVDYVNAHGTSTPLNDRAETFAIKAALGEHAANVPVSSTKSAIGHLLGAAGAVEAIATVLALGESVAPPTLGYEEPEEGLDLDYVPGSAREPSRAAQRPRTPPGRAVERLRIRRTQRRAGAGGAHMTAQLPDRASRGPHPARAAGGPVRPGPFEAIRSSAISRRMGEGPPGRRRHRRRGSHRRAPGLLLRPGPRVRRRLAGRGARGHDRPRPAARRAGRGPRRGLHRVGRRAAAGGSRRPRRLRTGLQPRTSRSSGRVPQISIINGVSRRRRLVLPRPDGLRDHDGARAMFLTGPGVVRDVLGEDVDAESLGGPRVHERNGVAQFVVRPTTWPPRLAPRELLELPAAVAALDAHHRRTRRRRWPATRATSSPPSRGACTTSATWCARLADDGDFLEYGPRWARNMVCAFGRIEGRPVGFVCNQPRHLGGVIDADAAQQGRPLHPDLQRLRSGARRPRRHPGIHARHGAGARGRHPPRGQARLRVRRGDVPRVTVTLRKSFGGALHRDELARPRRGPDLRLAWRAARRHGRQAGRRRAAPARDRGGARIPRPRATGSPRSTRTSISTPPTRWREGFVDELIEPGETRGRLAWALSTFSREGRRRERVANIPL